MITMTYWGFDDKPHTGQLVVNASVAEPVASVFKKLYDFRYPIKRMEPVDKYKADDYASIDADNTSAFNCRARDRVDELVAARLRLRGGPEPAGEPLRGGGRRARALQRRQLRGPPAEEARRDQLGRPGGEGLREHRMGLGRRLERHEGLPALLEERPLRPRTETAVQ